MDKVDVLDHGFVRLVDSMGSDVSVARSARVSHDAAWRAGEDAGSDARLIHYLWKHSHTTPFESVTFTFEVKAPIFVLRQWHRHRMQCLSGDTMITFECPYSVREKGTRRAKYMRLDELYRKWQPTVRADRPQRQTNALWPRSTIQRMSLRVYDEANHSFAIGHIEDVVASGVKQVFEIELEGGRRLKCSKDHLLLTTDGWQRLEDAVGLVMPKNIAGMTKEASILTNGVPVYTSKEWMGTQRASGSSVSEMAVAGGCSYHTIRKWLRIHGLQFTNAEIGRIRKVWNKGVSGYKTKRVFTDAERKKLSRERSGSGSNFWKGGITPERARISRWTSEVAAPIVHRANGWRCVQCGSNKELEAHHIKPVVHHPELAYDIDNITTLCHVCHKHSHGQTGEMRMGGRADLTGLPRKVVGVRYVGEEQTYDIAVGGPHHNFVANGMIVHNSYNELSSRYRELATEYYMPSSDQMRLQSAKNKQGSDGVLAGETAEDAHTILEDLYDHATQAYDMLIKRGVARELARLVLPVATYSHMFTTLNLLNLFRFLTLRCDEHAQWEIRVYADAMRELIRPIVPVCVAAWEAGG